MKRQVQPRKQILDIVVCAIQILLLILAVAALVWLCTGKAESYTYAVVKMPYGDFAEGPASSIRYGGETIEVIIDGITYETGVGNVWLFSDNPYNAE